MGCGKCLFVAINVFFGVILDVCVGDLIDGRKPYYLLEELPANTLIGNVAIDAGLTQKYDATIQSKLFYSFLNMGTDDKQQLFAIGNKSSILKTTKQIDRDAICAHKITCYVKFDVAVGPSDYFEVINIIVDILDINDHAPSFEVDDHFITVSESSIPGSARFSLPTAVDPDSATYGVQEYELVTRSNKFGLETTKESDGSIELRLVIKEKLDREEADFYQFQMVAYDGGSPPRSGSIMINIQVEDSNDNDPKFDNATYEVFVLENIPPNTTIARVNAKDVDAGPNGKITYAFSNATIKKYGHLFGIMHDTGTLYLKESLDFEHGSTYLLVVTAHDHGPDSRPAHASIIVRVEDSNDNPPQISVSTLTPNGVARIAESSKPGTFVAHVSAMDQDGGDNGRVQCSVDNNKFELESLYQSQYKIVTAAVLDKEHEPTYELTISCKDLGFRPKTTSVDILVQVIDDNDHAPYFSSHLYTAVIQEGNFVDQEIMKMNASDEDIGPNGDIRYSLDSDGSKLLQINPISGVITAKAIFDREKMEEYAFRVIAKDMGEPPMSSSTTVRLTITDVNDEKPVFTQRSFAFGTFENQAINTEVGSVVAIDHDLADFNSFEYKFANPTSNASRTFSIDPRNGKIITRRVLDREMESVYYLTVVAASDQFPPMSSTASVTIYVADKNDNAPVIDWPNHGNKTMYISSLVPVGHEVASVQAHDKDIGGNGKLSYSFENGNYGHWFDINPATGMITTNSEFDSIAYEEFVLSLKVQDNGFPHLEVTAILIVIVNSSISYIPPPRILYTNNNTTIIVSLASAFLLLIFLLIIAIVLFFRQNKDKKTAVERKYKVETQKMLNDRGGLGRVREGGDGREKQSPIGEWAVQNVLSTPVSNSNYVVNMGCNDTTSPSHSYQSNNSSTAASPSNGPCLRQTPYGIEQTGCSESHTLHAAASTQDASSQVSGFTPASVFSNRMDNTSV